MATPERESYALPTAEVPSAANNWGAKYKDVTIDGKTFYGALDVGSMRPPAALEIGMISAASGLPITGTDRSMYYEKEARKIGYTPEYIAARGGINQQGYFNDTPIDSQLTAEEYKSVTKPDGSIDSQKMSAILNAKGKKGNIFTGGNGGGGGSNVSAGGFDAQGNPTPGGQYNAQGQFVGNGLGGEFAGAVGTPEQIAARKSAYDLLYEQFSQYGLGALVEPLKGLVMEGVSPSEFTIRLRETEPYKKRFAANAQRIAKGLSALSEAEYINLEDQYQNIMRAYGLPASYYQRGEMGIQPGFEKFLAGDVSATELEDRIQTAQNRVFYANPEVTQALRQFYPGITNGDILAYALDPETALPELKRKVTAAEIGAGAIAAGLTTDLQRANELASYGITKEQARQGFQTVADITPRGTQLSEFYKQSPYTQTTAEAEVFGTSGSTEAARQRKKLTSLEQAAFSGSSGMAGGALARDRAGAF